MVSAPVRREQVRYMAGKGLSERRALRVVGMSASALRYTPRPDRNVELRAQILGLAHRHKRYGVGMIYLKLRQGGHAVNYKRVERLYQQAKLQVRRRKRKKVPVGERQPLIRPIVANEVWSMGNPPIFSSRQKWSYAAIASFCIGVMPPSAMFGRSWLYVHSQRVALSCTWSMVSNRVRASQP